MKEPLCNLLLLLLVPDKLEMGQRASVTSVLKLYEGMSLR